MNLPPAGGVVRLPASALMFRQQGMTVAVLGSDGLAHLKRVTIQRDLGATVEVTGGLAPTEKVINNPPDSITEDEAVKAVGAGEGGPVKAEG
jgi:hypothetical protein